MSPREVCQGHSERRHADRGAGGLPNSYNTSLNEQNIFKNPYKFFIICYTFRDNIYNKRKGEGGERNLQQIFA